MPLSWNEIKSRALLFTQEWKDEVSEDAEAKSFWDDFFNVFGISRRRVASFEQQVKKIDLKQGYIDLLWKGRHPHRTQKPRQRPRKSLQTSQRLLPWTNRKRTSPLYSRK